MFGDLNRTLEMQLPISAVEVTVKAKMHDEASVQSLLEVGDTRRSWVICCPAPVRARPGLEVNA